MMGRVGRRLALAAAVLGLLVSSCGSGFLSIGSAQKEELRSLGVHFNADTGLLVVTAGDVTTEAGTFPEMYVAFADIGPRAATSIPATCSGGFTVEEESEQPRMISSKVQYRIAASGAPLFRERILEWSTSSITLTDCGELSGVYDGEVSVFPPSPGPKELATGEGIWEIIPVLPTVVTGKPPTLPIRLPAQLAVSGQYTSDNTWIRNSRDVIVSSTSTTPGPPSEVLALEPSALLVSNVGNSKSAKFLGIRAGLDGSRDSIPALTVADSSKDVCHIEGEIVLFDVVGQCDVIAELQDQRRGVRIDVKKLLPRSTVDRPGANVLDIKPVYITFRDGADDARDTDGTIATLATNTLDFFAEQHPGFELRLDTYNGLPDIQHVELPITREQFLTNWNTTYGPIAGYLKRAGLDINMDAQEAGGLRNYALTNRIYFGIVESVTGSREGFAPGHTTPGCFFEASAGLVLFYGRDTDNRSCTERHDSFRYRGSRDANFDSDIARRFITPQNLRANIGCDKEFRKYFELPIEESDNYLVQPNDPIMYRYLAPQRLPLVMDEGRKFYLRIAESPRAGDPCWDLAYSPYWMRMGSRTGQDDSATGRVTTDRPDDSTQPQVKAYYVLAADSVDDRYDVGGEIAKQITTSNEWLFTNGGKRLRWDTYKGAIDVQFVRLKQTEAELWMEPDNPSKKCRFEQCPSLETLVLAMQEQGFSTKGKITAVFYGGQRTFASHPESGACAWGGWGKAGHVAMYLVADTDPMTGTTRCSPMSEFTKPTNATNTVGLAMIHEVFHALGAVAFSGPPNGDGDGHIKNDETDLMGGSQGIVRLDPGNDDYWRHGRSSFVDVYRSAFMNPPEPNAVLPANW